MNERSLIEIRARYLRGLPLTTSEETALELADRPTGLGKDRSEELRAVLAANEHTIRERAMALVRESGLASADAKLEASREVLSRLGLSDADIEVSGTVG